MLQWLKSDYSNHLVDQQWVWEPELAMCPEMPIESKPMIAMHFLNASLFLRRSMAVFWR